MAAHLLIRDGSPQWWLSPDIWVVPGNDPNGLPGVPVAGQAAYLWAHVANTGDIAASGTRIDFYWANPAMQVVVGAATQIGSAYADIPAGGAQDVLCLVPWVPSIVNGGHECVLAVAHNTAELPPLPDPLPAGFDFNPPAYDEIAQRNLSVVQTMMMVPFPLTITAPARADKEVVVTTEVGGTLDERILIQLGLGGFRLAAKEEVEVDVSRDATGHRREREHCARDLGVHVPRGTSTGVFVTIQAKGLSREEYQLVHVLERSGDRVLGGMSYVVVHFPEGDEA
ncbi:hypothetical protein [Paraburkholderia atlantica]|uniref:hypothetical protein n=1 Tax=Paraburkholderia atlantica TaxID=2654982 RepID=UPI00160AA32B|nr:hypothetical protein [Paraburkholderia atlantica]MBB5420727.1 hypothetical protein [Paraburkholderia atlantica]